MREMKTLWAVKTPKGDLAFESIEEKQWQAIDKAIWEGVVDRGKPRLSPVYEPYSVDPWEEAKKLGFKCVKVKIVEVEK